MRIKPTANFRNCFRVFSAARKSRNRLEQSGCGLKNPLHVAPALWNCKTALAFERAGFSE